MRIFLCLLSLFVALVGLQGGCTCAQNIVIPGLDGGNPQADGGTEPQDGTSDGPAPVDTPVTSDVPGPGEVATEQPVPDASVPEDGPDRVVTTSCPNPADVVCEACTAALAPKEAIVMLHKQFLLTQAEGQFKLYDLTKGCNSRPFVWSGVVFLEGLHGDPDSTKVLLLGYAKAAPGGVPDLRLAFFDLAQPDQALRELALPASSFRGAARSGLDSHPRRGLLTYNLNTGGEVYVHYQMDGALLHLMSIPDGSILFRSASSPIFFAEHEVFVLQVPTPRSFPLAVWSVKEQKIVRVIERPGLGVPQNLFASSQDVFTMDTDPQDRTKKIVTVYPIAGGASSTLNVPGCHSFFGDSVMGILACLGKDMLYRFKLPDRTPLTPMQMTIDPQFEAYFSGQLFITAKGDPQRVWMIDLLAATATLTQLPDTFPAGLRVVGPAFPKEQSKATLPGPNYRLLQGNVNNQFRSAVLDLVNGKLNLLSEIFPMPAIMGRQTEYWSFYPGSLSYLVEFDGGPTQRASLFFIRKDTGAIFHREEPFSSPYSFNGGINVSAGTQRLQVIGQTKYIQGPPQKEESELIIANHGRYKVQKLTLERSARVYHSDQFMVLSPTETSEPQQLRVYRVAE